MMTYLQFLTWVCVGLFAGSFAGARSEAAVEVRERLVSGLSGRPYGAVIFDGSLYFSLEQNQSAECPAANVFRVSAKPDSNKTVAVDFVAEVPCFRKMQVVGKRLFLFERVGGVEVIRLFEQEKWVTIPESTLKDVYRDRLAWLAFRLDQISDAVGDREIAKSSPVAWSVSENSPAGGKGLNLSMVLRSANGRLVHYQIPLEDNNKKVRPISTVLALPVDFAPGKFEIAQSQGKLLLYEIAATAVGNPRAFLWDIAKGGDAVPVASLANVGSPAPVHPTTDGFLVVDSHRQITDPKWGLAPNVYLLDAGGAVVAEPKLDADLSGITPLDSGFLVSKGYTGEIGTVGTSVKWTRELTGFTAAPTDPSRMPVFPKPIRVCKAHVLSRETSDLWSIHFRGRSETVPMAYAQAIASASCNGESLAIVAKFVDYNLAQTRIALFSEEGENGVDGGTNVPGALVAIEQGKLRLRLAAESGLLHVLKSNSVVLVRAPHNGTTFTRVRPRPEPPGFRIWLSAGGEVFQKYLNIVDSDGKEFYVEDVASNPYPDADAQSLEGVSP